MMKVVSFDPAAVKHCTCRSCSAKLEYTQSEVKERHGTDYGGGPDGEKWIDCPNCGKKVVLER